MDYSLPAGIFSDDPESYRPQKGEKKIAKWLKIKAKALSENVDKQKSLKSKHMGHTFVKCLLNRGMEVCVEKILSYLNWFHVALLLALLGSPMNNLNHLAAAVSHSIIKNTNHTNHHLLGKNLIHENTVTLIYLQKLIFSFHSELSGIKTRNLHPNNEKQFEKWFKAALTENRGGYLLKEFRYIHYLIIYYAPVNIYYLKNVVSFQIVARFHLKVVPYRRCEFWQLFCRCKYI